MIPYLDYGELRCDTHEYTESSLVSGFRFGRINSNAWDDSHMVDLLSDLRGISISSSIMLVLVYVPTNSELGCLSPKSSLAFLFLNFQMMAILTGVCAPSVLPT